MRKFQFFIYSIVIVLPILFTSCNDDEETVVEKHSMASYIVPSISLEDTIFKIPNTIRDKAYLNNLNMLDCILKIDLYNSRNLLFLSTPELSDAADTIWDKTMVGDTIIYTRSEDGINLTISTLNSTDFKYWKFQSKNDTSITSYDLYKITEKGTNGLFLLHYNLSRQLRWTFEWSKPSDKTAYTIKEYDSIGRITEKILYELNADKSGFVKIFKKDSLSYLSLIWNSSETGNFYKFNTNGSGIEFEGSFK